MKKFFVVMMSVFLFYAFLSCAQKEEKKGPYLAKVGNVKITQADLDRELKSIPEFAQKIFEGAGGKERFLDEIIKKELLYQEALKKGFDKNEEFQKKVEDFKKITLISLLLEKEIEAKAEITDQDVKDYYEKNKNEFAQISQIRARHILVKTEDEAKKILERIKKGEDFAKIAQTTSIDTGTAKNGGDLGYFSPGQLVPEFEEAAARLKTGEISQPVKTKFGYHIIEVIDKKMGKPVEFERVKNLIFQRLSATKQKEAFDKYIENLKKSYKVEINKDALSQISGETEQKKEVPEKQGPEGKSDEQSTEKKKD